MVTVALQVAGVLALMCTALLGRHALQRDSTPGKAARISRMCHAAFYGGLIAPYVLGLFVPGASSLDGLLGLRAFPLSLPVRVVIGVALLVPGGYFSVASNKGLATTGKGALAFKLTSGLVADKVYGRVRNPMAVGFYLGCVAFAFLFGSFYLLIYALVLIAAHVFYLKVFEERELSVRYGEDYEAYRAKTPFLIPRLFSSNDRSARDASLQ